MNWRWKMILAMKLIQEACDKSTCDDIYCFEVCPFEKYCAAIYDAKVIDPMDGLTKILDDVKIPD